MVAFGSSHFGPPTAPCPRQLEREAHDAADLFLRIRQRVPGGSQSWLAGGLVTLAEVDPAGELADDQHVDAREEFGAEGR